MPKKRLIMVKYRPLNLEKGMAIKKAITKVNKAARGIVNQGVSRGL